MFQKQEKSGISGIVRVTITKLKVSIMPHLEQRVNTRLRTEVINKAVNQQTAIITMTKIQKVKIQGCY